MPRVIDISSWNGSPSRWSTAESYCNACLIDLNAAAGRDDKVKSLCKVPVRRPGDPSDAMVDEAVFAAASGARGLLATKKPEEVSQEDWDRAVKSAANQLISAYNAMDDTAPDHIYELAGKTPPEERSRKENQMSTIQTLYRRIQDLFQPALEKEIMVVGESPVERISMQRVWAQLMTRLRDEARSSEGDPGYVVDIYYDRGVLYSIVARDGRLFRMDLSVDDDEVQLGSETRVAENFFPVAQTRTRVVRQADGTVRGLTIAATSVLNREGEIDTTTLFDNFVQRARESGEYPVIDFAHAGEKIRFGQADWVGRDGNVYMIAYEFDDTPIGRAAAKGLEEDPEYWGSSITYDPLDGGLVQVSEDVFVPAYTDGINRFVSIVPQRLACNLFTRHIVNRGGILMDEKLKRDLQKLVGEDLADDFAEDVDEVNRVIEESGMIARSTSEEESEVEEEGAEASADEVDEEDVEEDENVEEEGQTETGDETLVEETEVIIDEEALTSIAGAVVESDTYQQSAQAIDDRLNEVEQQLGDVARMLGNLDGLGKSLKTLKQRLTELEVDERERLEEYAQDMPRKRRLRVRHRPRVERGTSDDDDDEEEEPESVAVAENTLANLPTSPGYRTSD